MKSVRFPGFPKPAGKPLDLRFPGFPTDLALGNRKTAGHIGFPVCAPIGARETRKPFLSAAGNNHQEATSHGTH